MLQVNNLAGFACAPDIVEGPIFHPSSLFAASEDGAVYDPSDITSLYQETDGGDGGAVDSVVGMVLDKRLMGGQTAAAYIASQPELVTNGTFDADSDWSFGAEVEITGGALRLIEGTGGDAAYQSITGSAGYYTFQFTVSDLAGPANVRVEFSDDEHGTNLGAGSDTVTTNGTYEFILQRTDETGFRLRMQNGAGAACTIDNVSVKHVPGNHLVAPSDAARPILRQSGGLYSLELDGIDDEISTSISGLGATSTLVTAIDPGADARYILHTSDTARYGPIVESGGSGAIMSGSGSPTYRMDGASEPWTTRDNVYDDMTGAAHVLTIEGLSMGGWTSFGVKHAFVSWELSGDWFGTVLIDRALTSEERANVEAWMASRSGVTLA